MKNLSNSFFEWKQQTNQNYTYYYFISNRNPQDIYSIKFKRGTFCNHFLNSKSKTSWNISIHSFTPPEKSSLPFHARKKIFSRTRERDRKREKEREREAHKQDPLISFITRICVSTSASSERRSSRHQRSSSLQIIH